MTRPERDPMPPRFGLSGAWVKKRIVSGWPVYPANLCLVLRDIEFAGKREDFGKPIGKAVEIASHRTVGQSAAEHFHDMLRGAQRVKDAVEIGLGERA